MAFGNPSKYTYLWNILRYRQGTPWHLWRPVGLVVFEPGSHGLKLRKVGVVWFNKNVGHVCIVSVDLVYIHIMSGDGLHGWT